MDMMSEIIWRRQVSADAVWNGWLFGEVLEDLVVRQVDVFDDVFDLCRAVEDVEARHTSFVEGLDDVLADRCNRKEVEFVGLDVFFGYILALVGQAEDRIAVREDLAELLEQDRAVEAAGAEQNDGEVAFAAKEGFVGVLVVIQREGGEFRNGVADLKAFVRPEVLVDARGEHQCYQEAGDEEMFHICEFFVV